MHWWAVMADGIQAHMPDALQRARLLPLLQQFADRVEGVRTVVLASVDGFALVQAGTSGNGERLAAMTKVLMLALPGSNTPLLLMAGCDQRTVIGQVLWNARECGQAVLAELGGS